MLKEREHIFTNRKLVITNIKEFQVGNWKSKYTDIHSIINDCVNGKEQYVDLYVEVGDQDTKEESKMKIRICEGRFEFFDIKDDEMVKVDEVTVPPINNLQTLIDENDDTRWAIVIPNEE